MKTNGCSSSRCVCQGDEKTAEEILQTLMQKICEVEKAKGVEVDFWKYLPSGKDSYSGREVLNAIGKALDEVGVPNNLYLEDTNANHA